MKTLLLLSILTAYVASGYAITCTKCFEVTSLDPTFPLPADPSLIPCSNPGEMVCDGNVTSCMTTTIITHFTRDAGPLTVMQEARECGPPFAGFLPSGDTCADEATTAAITSQIDPTTMVPPGLGLTFEDFEASICSCDSSDRCTPPSAATIGNPQPQGSAITCTICSELISRDPTFPIPVDPSQIPCSNPGEMVCDEGVTSCMTTTMTMHFSRDAGPLTVMQQARECGFPFAGFLPSGDTCADEATTAAITSQIDPTTLFPPGLGLTFEDFEASICVCDSSDRCTPPSAATIGNPQPQGSAITCTKCSEVTSRDPTFPLPVDPTQIPCSNPGEMVCDEGVTSCMTTTMMMHFSRDAGPLTVMQMARECAPPFAGFLPSGDTCAGEAITAAFTRQIDPNTLVPPGVGLSFEDFEASICSCDSSDRCTPPSATTNGYPQPEATTSAVGEEQSITDIRLVGGDSDFEGRVEIEHDGEWGTICDDSWDLDDATVVCIMLGFDGASGAPRYAQFGEGSGPILLDDVLCTGDEATLTDCSHQPFGQHNCGHTEDAGVICYTIDTAMPSVRLIGGSSINEGRVEVLYDGRWGTVCDDYWGPEDAGVACRMMGYDGASEAPGSARFGQGSGPIWLDDVMCSGEETDLADCPHQAFGTNNCGHYEDAGAVCSFTGTSAPTVRLVDGSSDNEGRVEILYGGQWGTVCDDYWGLDDAGVVCRMLGFGGAFEAPGYARFGQGSGTIWLDDVMCSGEETDLADCPHPAFGTQNCGHYEDAGAVCSLTG
eukprot:XP_797846.3 PREDICTED: soluble scavenger receptor cysteine-rich domain-containing protein SSC5D [Strongylocentrotus purpuratus]